MAEQEIVLREWAAEWFHIHVEGKLAPNTEGGYRNLIFNHIIPRLGGVALTNLSEKRIGYWSGQDWSISVSKTSAIRALEAGQDEKNCQPCWAIQEFL